MFDSKKPVIGMLHAPALLGSPKYQKNRKAVVDFVLKDAETLLGGKVNGLLLENYWDMPFFPEEVPPETVAHLSLLARAIKNTFRAPLGINVLRNDARSALAIAKASGAEFIRVNILTGARLTDQGIIEGKAHEVFRYREQIGASGIKIFADIEVKSSWALANRTAEEEVSDTLKRAGADGLIVSGMSTGKPVDLKHLQLVKSLSPKTPVWIGSGVDQKNIKKLSHWADGFVVGSSLKPQIESPIEKNRVIELMKALSKGRRA